METIPCPVPEVRVVIRGPSTGSEPALSLPTGRTESSVYPFVVSNLMPALRTMQMAATAVQQIVMLILQQKEKHLGPRRETVVAFSQILRFCSG